MTPAELAIRNKHNLQRRQRYAREKAADSEWYREKLRDARARYSPKPRDMRISDKATMRKMARAAVCEEVAA